MAGSLPASAYILIERTRWQRNDLGRRGWLLRRKPEQGEGRRAGSWRERGGGRGHGGRGQRAGSWRERSRGRGHGGRGAEGRVMEREGQRAGSWRIAVSDGVGTRGSDRVALEQSPLCTEGMNPVSRASMDPAHVCRKPTMCFVPGGQRRP